MLGLLRDVNGREALAGVIREVLLELVVDLVRIDIADDDDEEVIRDVAELVILHHVVALELVVNLDVADDGDAVWVNLEGGGHELEAGHAVGVIVAHGELAAYDLLLLRVLRGGERGIHHRIREEIEGGGDALRGDIDPEDRAIIRGVGIDVAALVLNLECELAAAARGGAFEEHVLEDVREAGAEVLVLIDAAGLAPCLEAGDGSGVILLDDDGEAILEGPDAGVHLGDGNLRR